MTDLLDVNVLVSLAWPNHVHHAAAQRWFRSRRSPDWATTAFTECGFVRVSSNRSAIPSAVTPSEALLLLARMRAVPGHVFLPDDVELVVGQQVDTQRLVTHGLVSDVHLLAVARRHEVRLATLDRGMRSISGTGADDVVLIPVP